MTKDEAKKIYGSIPYVEITNNVVISIGFSIWKVLRVYWGRKKWNTLPLFSLIVSFLIYATTRDEFSLGNKKIVFVIVYISLVIYYYLNKERFFVFKEKLNFLAKAVTGHLLGFPWIYIFLYSKEKIINYFYEWRKKF